MYWSIIGITVSVWIWQYKENGDKDKEKMGNFNSYHNKGIYVSRK